MIYFVIILSCLWLLAATDKFTFLLKDWKFLCKFPGWHKAKATGFDGCSYKGTCIRCGKSVLQDSNGDWF